MIYVVLSYTGDPTGDRRAPEFIIVGTNRESAIEAAKHRIDSLGASDESKEWGKNSLEVHEVHDLAAISVSSYYSVCMDFEDGTEAAPANSDATLPGR